MTKAKLKKGEYIWRRCKKVYVSKWRDRREVLAITTKYHPKLISVRNRFGQEKIKPEEIYQYNLNMAGIDHNDQMVSYYSSPRKTIRWYKKVMFHLLDIFLWNAYYIEKKYTEKMTFLQFCEEIIRSYLQIDPSVTDGRLLVKTGPIHGG